MEHHSRMQSRDPVQVRPDTLHYLLLDGDTQQDAVKQPSLNGGWGLKADFMSVSACCCAAWQKRHTGCAPASHLHPELPTPSRLFHVLLPCPCISRPMCPAEQSQASQQMIIMKTFNRDGRSVRASHSLQCARQQLDQPPEGICRGGAP